MQSLSQFFHWLNDVSFPYVVLRNWDQLPYSVELGQHGDLDLLVIDLAQFRELITEAHAEYPWPRVRFRLPVADTAIYLDVRSVGDAYYPEDFAQAILQSREWHPRGFFTPNPLHHRLALAYHCVHHKNLISPSYRRWLGTVEIPELLQALHASIIGWVAPHDPTVGRHHPYWKGATAIVSQINGHVMKAQVGFLKYPCLATEARVLQRCLARHFPRLIAVQKQTLLLEYCGTPLTVETLPADWRLQLQEILHDLYAFRLQHRDIRPENLLVKAGIIKLIDFGWARFLDDSPDTPPSCLGLPYRPSSGFNDAFSMRQVIKHFNYLLEQRPEVLTTC